MVLFWGQSRDNDVSMVLALNRISALFGIFFETLYATYSLDECLLLGEVSQESIRGIRDILQVLQKGFKLCMH